MNRKERTKYIIVIVSMLVFSFIPGGSRPVLSKEKPGSLSDILDYIGDGWNKLNSENLYTEQLVFDVKIKHEDNKPWIVYIPHREPLAEAKEKIFKKLRMALILDIIALPGDPFEFDFSKKGHGLIYLPHSYVFPGGRFNEMYGWDSYFILLGLLRDGRLDLAKGMVDNFTFEIVNYGKVLNANRSYYLNRSQPPFYTRMALEVYYQTFDKAWLEGVFKASEKYYRYWTVKPHLTPETGLSRYFGSGEGPCPEVVGGEVDETGSNHYDVVREFYYNYTKSKRKDLPYDIRKYYKHNNKSKKAALKELFYTADRSMRESGFDPSDRFGPFSAGIIDYNPVCLNTLLYMMEKDLAEMSAIFGRETESKKWISAYLKRKELINKYMWDDEEGMYFDYNFRKKRRSSYRFATTFYPLWAGIPDKEKAEKLAVNLTVFERPGGISTSDNTTTKSQWDDPIGWAPIQIIVTHALEKYGYEKEAQRVAVKWCSTVLGEFRKYKTIFEKYDVNKCSYDVDLGAGYRSNEIGFGWTNASFLILHDMISNPEELLK